MSDQNSVMEETLNQREHEALLMAYQLGLEKHFWHVLQRNPAKTLPYHSNQHLFTVAVNSAKAAQAERLSPSSIRSLFLAGLYHDWNHSGSSDESLNIPAALEGFLTSVTTFPVLALEDSTDTIKVCELIAVTDARRDKTVPLTVEGRIIRDADLSQWAEPDFQVFLAGLSEEFGTDVTVESTKQFLAAKPLETAWVRDKLAETGWL